MTTSNVVSGILGGEQAPGSPTDQGFLELLIATGGSPTDQGVLADLYPPGGSPTDQGDPPPGPITWDITLGNTVTFSQSIPVQKTLNITVGNTVTFSNSSRDSTFRETLANTVTFAQSLSVQKILNLTTANTVVFSNQVARLYEITTANTVVFSAEGIKDSNFDSLIGEAITNAVLQNTRKSEAVGEAFTTGRIEVVRQATNPPLSGDLVDIGNNAVFQLTVNGDLIDFTQVTSCFHAFNMGDLDVSYEGKELTFEEFTGIGSATYRPEQDVTLEIDFSDGMGLTRLFTGKIKQRDHDGRNNNESISYTAIDYLQLADDLTAVGSDGYPQITWTAPTTVTTVTSAFGTFVGSVFANGEIPINQQAPTKIHDAISDYFDFNSANLIAAGIPTAIGAPGLEQFTAELPETVTLDAEGFAAGLITLAGYQTGVKVLFDEKQQAWVFHNLQTVPTVIVDIASTNIPELPFSVDTTDRYTAVRLYADITDENDLDNLIQEKSEIASLGGPLGFGKIERTEVTLSPYWLRSLENQWSLFLSLYSDPTQIQGDNYFVYRRFSLPEGTERPGFGLKARAFAQYNQWGNVYWAPLEGQVNWNKRYFLAAYPAISRGNPWHPGQAIPAQEVKLAYIPAAIRYLPATTITSGGNIGYSATATIAQRGDFSDELRYPETGFEGTAYTDFGIEREYIEVRDRTQVTVENAKALLDIRKDAVVSGEIPIDGDPIPELIGLGVKVLVQHPVKSTSIETFAAFVTNYSYTFGKRGQSTVSLSTDISGLVT